MVGIVGQSGQIIANRILDHPAHDGDLGRIAVEKLAHRLRAPAQGLLERMGDSDLLIERIAPDSPLFTFLH